MALTQAQVDAFEQALVDRGFVRTMQIGDRTFTFDSIDDAWATLAKMKSALAASNGSSRSRVAAFDKGV
jgi:hypothetical protein